MQFFQELRRDNSTTTFFFFPGIHEAGLYHFLREENITGWEILTKYEVLPYLPEGFQIPEVRLTPTAPRVEKRVACLVSYYNTDDLDRAYQHLTLSRDWSDWHNRIASEAMKEYEFQEAMARDPSPLSPFRPNGTDGML